jgi:phosphatidylglycerophosphate synthase
MRQLPNLISLSRLVAVILLIVAASFNASGLCLILFGYCLVSDVVDGQLARAFGLNSVLGARLDSLADCALTLTIPFVALRLLPALRATDTITVLFVFAGYAIPMAWGMLKFRRLTSYHTTAARVAGVLLAGTFLLFVATRVGWPMRAATAVLLLSALEEMAITHTLTQWRSDVPNLRRAREIVRLQSSTWQPSAAERSG